jgi:hypothetical protein
VTGWGQRFDVNRTVLAQDTFELPIDSVVLFETNVARPSGAIAALTVISGISVGVTVFCAANPKACFGSCPTFYAEGADAHLIHAEGFSASVAPSLEASDLDHLYRVHARPPAVRLRMTNEALETHVVRRADLIAAPRRPGTRVFADETGALWVTSHPTPPTSCTAPEGSCLNRVRAFDGDERMSAADSTDLAAREVMEMTFPTPAEGRPAVVLASRQSLLPTYLLYQAFAYMGTAASDWLAGLERRDAATTAGLNRVAGTLGGIEILVRNAVGEWVVAAEVVETGPLATDVRIVPLPVGSDPARVRLRMAAGAWRVDWIGLTGVTAPAEHMRLRPTRVVREGTRDDDALSRLLHDDRTLVTFPGDAYTLVYDFPADADADTAWEIFLDSRGYYLEWMRAEWLAEENPFRAMQLFTNPAAALRALAPEFKRAEPGLEAAFWRSRYVGH